MSIKELPRIVRFLPKIVLAVIVTACDEVYRKIAYWLNDMGEEPHRAGRAYAQALWIPREATPTPPWEKLEGKEI